MSAPSTVEAINLEDPALFSGNDFWPVLAALRARDPLYWHPSTSTDQGGFWVLSKHADVAAAYLDSDTFSSRSGMNLGGDAAAVEAVAQQMLIVSDPPDHTRLKRALNEAFNRKQVLRLDGLIAGVVADIIAEAGHARTLDFVDVAKKLPNHVVCAFMGLPRVEWEWIGQITTDAFEGDTAQIRQAAHAETFLYFDELVRRRREQPSGDLVSAVIGIADALSDEAADGTGGLTDTQIVLNLSGILSGANETTRYSSAGAVLALAENPDQLRLLQDDTDAVAASAVEEVLRWTVPGLHAMRTLTRDRQLHGKTMRAGEKVTLWNCSANRDEDLFTDAGRFRIDRSPNRHLTFGAGRHLCLGARLARLELKTLLTSFGRGIGAVELTGEPVYNSSNFTWGISSLPVRLTVR